MNGLHFLTESDLIKSIQACCVAILVWLLAGGPAEPFTHGWHEHGASRTRDMRAVLPHGGAPCNGRSAAMRGVTAEL